MYAIIHCMNLKKIYFIVPLLLTPLSGCSNVDDEYEVCLILSNANTQGYQDRGFNQSCYEAIIDFCEPRDITYNYYIPSNEDDKGYLDAVNRAVDDGAKLIVCAGYSFTTVIETAANTYQNVKFVLLDDTLEGLDNCVSITFNEEESGYLAGYALGMEGMKTVGFVGGGQEDDEHNKILVDPIVRFGLGFIYGISDAWKFLSQQKGYDEVVKIYYGYCYTFEANDRLSEILTQWYAPNVGIEAIFTCGGSITKSAIEASEHLDLSSPSVVGVDVNQGYLSDYVITSAMKKVDEALTLQLEAYYNGAFEGGKVLHYSAKENAIGLPLEDEYFRFNNFTTAQYDEIYKRLQNNLINFDNLNIEYGKTEQGVSEFAYSLDNVDITWSDIVF